MRIVRQPPDLGRSSAPVGVAIGVFDGVHLGHQRVLRDLQERARAAGALAVAVTFDRHPSVVVAPDRTPPLIQTLSQRLASLASLGLEATWLIEFDRRFSEQTGEEFVRRFVDGFGRVVSIHVGDQFHFGLARSGNAALLRQLEPVLGFTTHSIPAVNLDGQVVSSTRIRQAIRTGDFTAAGAMLGRPYALAGRVVEGDRLGRQLGFPTANLDVAGLVLPPNGVYTARVRWARGEADAVVNIGMRPTLGQVAPQIRVEAHLLDFQADLYGQELELSPLAHLRAEQAFASLDALKAQIERDVAAARAVFNM